MNIDKKLSQEGAHETASTIDFFKSKNTGELMYKTQYGKSVSMADKDYVNDTVNTAIAEAISEPMSSIAFGVDMKTVGPKVVFTKTNYGNEVDRIIPGEVEITRGNSGGLYNSALQEGYGDGGPLNTYWNSEFTDSANYGWAKLGTVIEGRHFDTWSNSLSGQAGVNIIGRELVMVAEGDNTTLFFMIKFTQWTEGQNENGNGGGFSYERYQIFPTIEFIRPSDQPDVVDVVSDGLIIKRNNIRGLFNAVLETQYDRNHNTSPKGTRWSSIYTDPILGGSTDYSNVRERIYDTWQQAVDNNPPGNLGTELIMHDLSTDLYWLIVVSAWGIGDDGDLGNVTYSRTLLPLDEGIKFSNGTYMTELPTNEPVVDIENNLIVANSSTNTVDVAPGGRHSIPNFSGMLIVNDHYDGRVETWIAGGGDTVCLGATNTGGSPVGSTLSISGSGYDWFNDDNLTGPFTFTVIKTRNEA